jgi:transitional endoplasmic reticulum ATPase
MSNHIESLRLALHASPDNAPLLEVFAKACLEDFLLEEAATTFQHLLALQPEHAGAKLGLAQLAQLQGKTSEAILRAEAALKTHPDDGPLLVFLSSLLAGEGELAQARRLYDKALKLDRRLADAGLDKALAGVKPEPEETANKQLRMTENGPMAWDADDGSPRGGEAFDLGVSDFERPKTNFSHVGGMESVKEEIRMKIIYPLQHTELFKAYGKKTGGGVLLYGPPGCGKTLISKATAGEINANFISLGIHQVLDMFIGNSEKNLHSIFELARKNAPCVLFFDEVDALAADRRDLRQSAGRNLINQFLSEMDGADSQNEGVLILGATNAPWHIDPAFRRPGRFDRSLFIPPPDDAARAAILQVMAKDKPMGEFDPIAVAKKTDGFSGADLKAVFDIATEEVLDQAMRTGKVIPLTTKDLAKASGKHKATTRSWFETAKNYAMYSNQGGLYDEVLKFLKITK